MSGVKGLFSFSGNASFYSSNTIVSHWTVVLNKIYGQTSFRSKAEGPSFFSNSFQNTTEIILANWNRVLLGPEYNVDKRKVGLRLVYIKIYDYFSYNIGYESEDISNGVLRFIFDFSWRW